MHSGKSSDSFLDLGRVFWHAFREGFLESPVLMFGIPWLVLKHGLSAAEAEARLRAWMFKVGWIKACE